MSRFLPDRLYVGIEPDRVALVRQSGLFKKRIVADAVRMLDLRTPEGLLAFGQELASERWRGCSAHIVLADRLLHYFIAERPQGVRNAQEINLAFALRFEELFGEAVADWEFRASLSPLASNDLVCACRKTLLAGVLEQFQLAHTSIRSITPFAIAEWNARARLACRDNVWFVVAGRDGLWVARREKGAWLVARQLLWREGLQELPQLLRRETLRLALDEETPQVTVTGLTGRVSAAQLGKRICLPTLSLWPGQSTAWSEAYRIALSPVWPACA